MEKGDSEGGCGCKGIRRCLRCEAAPPPEKAANFTYCPRTGFALGEKHSAFAGWAFPFPGVCLLEDFVSAEEEDKMVALMDQDPWKPSQSGRRKQDYGPKVNFKKRKLKADGFAGLPSFSREIVKRMGDFSVLEGFSPVEQCNLDYGPERGSAIDPHWDDWWLWGERLVSLNLLSATVLSMSCDLDDPLQLFPDHLRQSEQTPSSGSLDTFQVPRHQTPSPAEEFGSTTKREADGPLSTRSVPSREVIVAIHLPRRSLVVLHGPARHRWKHAIYRNHITSRRICITFRELSAEFSLGGKQEELGKKLLGVALTFQGRPV
ncbi:alpha-ketoglutarate-dependent dioxygenase alkB homolog 4 [Sceloporus undulatus]|uniref:alpha-ketoglutarate-dependent dioxygenase alkB homolog 4 n=1 Tax=Sceloporus undulatus TaxID=8520 RepID=UPI001C4C7A97|nr:alpha-ketoglutarate-dependent dioxygenase alkB homolog 4 [Sceloporus undulatus]